jgi:hypothetical protein
MSLKDETAVLEQININRINWGDSEGLYEGSVVFANNLGTIKLKLTPEISNGILAVVSKELINTTKVVANQLDAAVMASTKMLSAK